MTQAHDRLLALLLHVAAALAGVGLLVGAWLVTHDLTRRGEAFDGLGVAVGVGAGLPALATVVLALVSLTEIRRRRTRGWSVAAGAAGLLAVIPFIVVEHALLVLLAVPAALLVVALTAPRPPRVRQPT